MARARSIKPGLLKNELLGEADPLLTVLFIGLWTLADREGRLEDRPKRIRIETLPYRDGVDVDAMLDELERLGFVTRYIVGELRVIQIVNFHKHQSPHRNEVASELPGLSERTDRGEVASAPEGLRPMDEARRPSDDTLGLTADCGPPDPGLLTADHLDDNARAARAPARPAGVVVAPRAEIDAAERVRVAQAANERGWRAPPPAPLERDARPAAPADYLRWLVEERGYDDRSVRRGGALETTRRWHADGVTLGELDDAVEQASAQNDGALKSVSYLATIVAGTRERRARPARAAPPRRAAAALDFHGGFDAIDYRADATVHAAPVAAEAAS